MNDGMVIPYRIMLQRTGNAASPFTSLSDARLTCLVADSSPFISNWYTLGLGDTFWQAPAGGLNFTNISNQTDIETLQLNVGNNTIVWTFSVLSQLSGDPDSAQTLRGVIWYQIYPFLSRG